MTKCFDLAWYQAAFAGPQLAIKAVAANVASNGRITPPSSAVSS